MCSVYLDRFPSRCTLPQNQIDFFGPGGSCFCAGAIGARIVKKISNFSGGELTAVAGLWFQRTPPTFVGPYPLLADRGGVASAGRNKAPVCSAVSGTFPQANIYSELQFVASVPALALSGRK